MLGLGAGEIIVIVFLGIVFLGPEKIPKLAKVMGKGFREFQKAKDDLMNEIHVNEDSNDNLAAIETYEESFEEVEEDTKIIPDPYLLKEEEVSVSHKQ